VESRWAEGRSALVSHHFIIFRSNQDSYQLLLIVKPELPLLVFVLQKETVQFLLDSANEDLFPALIFNGDAPGSLLPRNNNAHLRFGERALTFASHTTAAQVPPPHHFSIHEHITFQNL